MFGRWTRRFGRYWRERDAISRLAGMDERILADMGTDRDHVVEFVRKHARYED